MSGRLVSMLGRGSRLTRRLTLAALGVVVVLIVLDALAPAPRPAQHHGGPRPGAARGPTTSSSGSPVLPPGELADARRDAARFLAGYLPFLYGRGSARAVDGATPDLRLQLTRTQALVTPAERRRHPRLISLAAIGRAPGGVLVTALVEDGGVTTYALRIALRRGPGGWLVSGVEGG